MSNGEVSDRDGLVTAPVEPNRNIAGQKTICELLRLQDAAPVRSRIARVFGANPLSAASRATYKAAVGEVEVGAALEGLGDDWTVLHSVPVGDDADPIDHLVVGRGGVYIVNTTVHTGATVWASQRTFMVADIRYPFIRNMEYEMGRVERLLSTAAERPVEVSAVLAVVEPKSLTVTEPHRDVAVISAAKVARWLKGRPRVLLADDVETIAAAAKLASTWHDSLPHADPDALRLQFAALQEKVTRAWSIQRTWATIATVVGAGGFIAVTYTILINALGV